MGFVPRQLPRWSELRPLVRLRPPAVGPRARARQATDVDDLRRLARRGVPRATFDYVDGGAGAELSLARSRAAFDRVEFRPRVLRDVSDVDTGTTLLGRAATMPLVLAPTGFTRLMHHEGEHAVAAAAAAAGVPYTLSTMGTVKPEELTGAGDRWFQLYLWRDRGATKDLVARAAAAGYRALMLTVDTPVSGARLRDLRNGLTIPPDLTPRTLAGMAARPAWWFNLLTTPPLTFASLTGTEGGLAATVDRVFDPRVTLADLEWLREVWPGPLIVKGVQCAADARAVVEAGADAVAVSNHGGRQLDRAVTPLEELPAVLDAVDGRAEVYVDGGVRTGADAVAAVGLGADACLIGRAYLYGLMAGGQDGVARALEIFRADLRRTLALLGVPRVADLGPDAVRLRPR
ncbi:alpha-hydroxy acid oxidase [Asanoa sp. NPDC050611]|uniref:alpha-hydroxy acid oxidase n=1 Tax=Asanoa sp. NPDC050611 TaxID=3157098 RepID=UPI0033F2ADE3